MEEHTGRRSRSYRALLREKVLDHLGSMGAASRLDLRATVGVSRSTMDPAIAEMLASGVLEEITDPTPRVGRPARLLRIAGTRRTTLAVMVRSRSVTAAIVDEKGAVHASQSTAAALGDGRESTLAAVAALAHPMVAEHTVDRVVVSLPTMVDPVGQRINPEGAQNRMPTWTDGRTVERVAELFPGVPVLVDNDAALAALAELRIGRSRAAHSALYVSVGANGIGGAVLCEGKLVRGAHGYAGQISHVCVDPNGVFCPCGRRGCLAAQVRDQVRRYRAARGEENALDGDDLLASPAESVAVARLVADIAGDVGRVVGSVVNLLDLDTVVVHDAMGNGTAAALVAAIPRFVHPGIVPHLRIVTSDLADRAVLQGAGLFELAGT